MIKMPTKMGQQNGDKKDNSGHFGYIFCKWSNMSENNKK